ncbi:MAG: hypothetical protein QMC73_05410, partial [Myxococcota bacterium]
TTSGASRAALAEPTVVASIAETHATDANIDLRRLRPALGKGRSSEVAVCRASGSAIARSKALSRRERIGL